eukprot:GAHX01000511.1.p2 GENE.GAHX01000511.1~~GAHX01000511.1.p2  ORF type:complete len:302 (-),score=74.52 GAHX01000511.1:1167-2072(-)
MSETFVAQAKSIEDDINRKSKKKGFFSSLFGSGVDFFELADLYTKAANNYRLGDLPKESVRCYEEAVKLYLKTESPGSFRITDCYKKCGDVLTDSDFSSALNYYNKAAEGFLQNSNFSLSAKLYQQMADLTAKHTPEDYESQIEYHEKAFKFYKAANSNFTAYQELIKVADFYAMSEDYKTAWDKYLEIVLNQTDDNSQRMRNTKHLFKALLCVSIRFLNNELDSLEPSFAEATKLNPYFSSSDEYTSIYKVKSAIESKNREDISSLLESIHVSTTEITLFNRIIEALKKFETGEKEIDLT